MSIFKNLMIVEGEQFKSLLEQVETLKKQLAAEMRVRQQETKEANYYALRASEAKSELNRFKALYDDLAFKYKDLKELHANQVNTITGYQAQAADYRQKIQELQEYLQESQKEANRQTQARADVASLAIRFAKKSVNYKAQIMEANEELGELRQEVEQLRKDKANAIRASEYGMPAYLKGIPIVVE
jgi:chromosome segregation ATPase